MKSISVVGSAADLTAGLMVIKNLQPDVVLVDLGANDGPATARAVSDCVPSARVVALAVSDVYTEIISWVEAGVAGHVTRDATVDDLVAAIEQTALDNIACPPHVVASLLAGLAVWHDGRGPPHPDGKLTAREWEIAQLLTRGMSNKEIACALTISLPTVKNHVHNVLRKLHVQRRADAARQLQNLRDPSA